MAGYKDLDFNERRAAAQKARETALAQLKNRPPVDEAEQARRRAEREARDAAQAEKRWAAKEARSQAAETVGSDADEAIETASPSAPQLTEEERKAARDARYAARKKNKGKR